jgi:ribosomal protein L3 glutamine methyltransferase
MAALQFSPFWAQDFTMQQTFLDLPDNLISIKDFIRWGASRFSEAGLFFGHGTTTALDDAAAIVLHSLCLPYQLSGSYLDSRLTTIEQEKIIALFKRRIEERIPSAYLTREAVFAGLSFYVDERVLIPRSPIAELIQEGFSPWLEKAHSVLDLCTGSACIAIACAFTFPEAEVDAVDYSREALAVAEINVNKYELNDQVKLLYSDLFENIPEKRYDLIVSNPPYVSLKEWQHLPKEFHAEPAMGFKGGKSGLDLVIKILAQAKFFLSSDGILVVEVGSSAQSLQDLFSEISFYWLEFERGGEGVLLLTAQQLNQYHELFNRSLALLCQETV